MRHFTQGRIQRQVSFWRQQFLQDGNLPFTHVLSAEVVSVPDTAENRKEYPLTYNQKPGTGFPVAQIGAIISLACGAIVNLGLCRYAGTGQSELGMLRKFVGRVSPRRRLSSGSLDVCLDRDGHAPATRRRLHLSPHITPHGRFSPWNASRQR